MNVLEASSHFLWNVLYYSKSYLTIGGTQINICQTNRPIIKPLILTDCIFQFRKIILVCKIFKNESWKYGSALRSTGYVLGWPKFDSHNPPLWSQLFVTLITGELVPLFGHQTHIQCTYIHSGKKKLMNKKSFENEINRWYRCHMSASSAIHWALLNSYCTFTFL